MELSELTVQKFADILGSDAPAPGGGSAAALEGALGAALTAMVSSLTLGRERYAQFEPFAKDLYARTSDLKRRFLAAMEDDTAVFSRFSQAMALPKDTEKKQQIRAAAMQRVLADCTRVPLHLMELSVEALHLTQAAVGKTNRSAVSDLGVAALSLKAAVQSAWLNVLINVRSLKDEQLAETFRTQGQKLLDAAVPLADRIYSNVEKSL